MSDPDSAKVYHISPMRQAAFPLIGAGMVVVLVVGAWFEQDPASSTALLLTAGTLFLVFLPFSLLVRYPRLTIAPDRIELRQFGWRIAAPWDDVAAICLDEGAQGLELNQPVSTSGGAILAVSTAILGVAISFYPPEHRKLIREHRWIPLEPFGWWFRHGQLRDDIARCAPWLFEDKPGPGEAR